MYHYSDEGMFNFINTIALTLDWHYVHLPWHAMNLTVRRLADGRVHARTAGFLAQPCNNDCLVHKVKVWASEPRTLSRSWISLGQSPRTMRQLLRMGCQTLRTARRIMSQVLGKEQTISVRMRLLGTDLLQISRLLLTAQASRAKVLLHVVSKLCAKLYQ